jgi:hypothetical protein
MKLRIAHISGCYEVIKNHKKAIEHECYFVRITEEELHTLIQEFHADIRSVFEQLFHIGQEQTYEEAREECNAHLFKFLVNNSQEE